MPNLSQAIGKYYQTMRVMGANKERFRCDPRFYKQERKRSGEIILGHRVHPRMVENEFGAEYEYDDFESEMVTIPFSQKDPPRIVLFGKSGCGKTTHMCLIIEQLSAIGMRPVVCLDPKSEMRLTKNMTRSISQYCGDFSYALYIPEFITERRLIHDRTEIKLSVSMFSPEELMNMYYKDDSFPTTIYRILLKSRNSALRLYGKNYNIEQLKACVEDIDDAPSYKRKAIDIIEILFEKGVISNTTNFDFIADMNRGCMPVVQFDNFFQGKDVEFLVSNLVSFMLRKLIENGKMNGLRSLAVIDESWIVAKNNVESPSKKQLESYIKYVRGNNCGVLVANQELNKISGTVLSQSNYIIVIGKYTAGDEEKLKFLGFDAQVAYDSRNICYVDQKTGKRVAALFNTNTGEVTYYSPVLGSFIPSGS